MSDEETHPGSSHLPPIAGLERGYLHLHGCK
jgi:hypothetical protein